MKIVSLFINLVIIPLGTLIFIMVGIVAAITSATIEFTVLKQLFTVAGYDSAPFAMMALLIVIAFEFTKIYLHFYVKKQSEKEVGERNSKYVTGIRVLNATLVTFSFICSIMFTVSMLYLPTFEPAQVDEKISFLQEQMQSNIEAIEDKYMDEYKELIAPYQANVSEIESRIQEYVGGSTNGPQTVNAYLSNLNEMLESAIDEYNNAAERLEKKKDEKIVSEIEKQQSQTEQKIKNLTDVTSPEVAAKYDNPIIAKFLTVLANVIFQKNTYSRMSYLCVSVFLGVLLSAILEAIIAISMQFISTPVDELADDTKEVNKKISEWCSKTVNTLFNAFLAITIYIIILFFFSASMEKEKICLALLSCVVSIFLTQKYCDKPGSVQRKEVIIYQIRDCILQGVVSLMGFVLLGFLFGNDALYLDVNTVAIGIGTTISGGIIQLPSCFLESGSASSC